MVGFTPTFKTQSDKKWNDVEKRGEEEWAVFVDWNTTAAVQQAFDRVALQVMSAFHVIEYNKQRDF